MLDRSAPRPTRVRPRVLLIEDNLTQLDLYALVLGAELDVLTATRAETGYVLATLETPRAIVLDILLPDGDGLQLAQRFLANPVTASIPVIVLTGDDRAFERARASTLHLDAVLKKPCSAERLLDVLRHALATRAVQ